MPLMWEKNIYIYLKIKVLIENKNVKKTCTKSNSYTEAHDFWLHRTHIFLDVANMKLSTDPKRETIFEEVKSYFKEHNILFENIMDGAASMVGRWYRVFIYSLEVLAFQEFGWTYAWLSCCCKNALSFIKSNGLPIS